MTTTSCLQGYVDKLEKRTSLSEAERSALLSLPATLRQYRRQADALIEGRPARVCAFVVNGVVSRQRQADGVRRIVGFGFHGDAVHLQSLFFDTIDHCVVTHGPTTLAYVEFVDLIGLVDRYPHIAKLLWHDTLVESSISREWTLNIGHRPAISRLAHLMLEFDHRIQKINNEPSSFELPLSQSDLASALGLSVVHLNKSLKKLTNGGLLASQNRTITISNRAELTELAQFNEKYLHLTRPPMIDQSAANGEMPRRRSEDFHQAYHTG